MTERRVSAGEAIIKQGEQGDYFYAIDQGRFIAMKDGEHKFTYDGTGSFGELALLYNSKRAATVMAETDGVLWALDRRSFRALVVGTMQQRRKRNEAVVQKTPLFKDLTERQLAAIADCLVLETFFAGTVIITQGDPVTSSSKFYIIEQGHVDCFRTKEQKKDGTPGKRKLTRSMGANDVFGEVALLTKMPRQADCVATTDVKVRMRK
jgi:cAMP-dependent protein kinase regulator